MTNQQQANAVEAILGDRCFCPMCLHQARAIIRCESFGITFVACNPCWRTLPGSGLDRILSSDHVEIRRGDILSVVRDRAGNVWGNEVVTDWL